jgi:RPA family protein
MSSFISVVGTITRNINRTDDGLCRFSVDNQDGRFYIQTPWSAQLATIRQADQVQIIGTLHSFTFPRCRCQHLYIEPLAIIQGSEVTPDSGTKT